MKAVFTCGGTGGHINPALAVARVLLERRPDSEILFVGAEDGMEATLVPREGFRLETLQISSYMRSLKPSAIRHNVRAALSIRRALKKADRIIRDFQPDGILGPNRVGERVKVMKCPKTGEYVMFMHADDMGYKDPYIGYATCKTIDGDYQLQGPLLYQGKPVKR